MRHAIVEVPCVNVVIGVVLGELLVGDAVVRLIHFVLIAFHRSHYFHVGFPKPIFCI